MSVLAVDAARPLGWALLAVGALVVLALVVLFVSALVSILRSRSSGGMKLVWVFLAFCAPFLGPVLWFVIGRKHADSVVGG